MRNPLNLPAQLPVFPLSGAVLMPFGHLPLNIFEPRYLHLVDDVLGSHRLIGMIQPRMPMADPVHDGAELYDIGTVGRIIQFQETSDGRYLIVLEGLSRFHIRSVSAPDLQRGYRLAEVEYAPFQQDLSPVEHDDGPGRHRILELMHHPQSALYLFSLHEDHVHKVRKQIQLL